MDCERSGHAAAQPSRHQGRGRQRARPCGAGLSITGKLSDHRVRGAWFQSEALAAVFAQRGIMIRQGSYHTPRFGSRLVKVSTTVLAEWVDAFCRALLDAIETARA